VFPQDLIPEELKVVVMTLTMRSLSSPCLLLATVVAAFSLSSVQAFSSGKRILLSSRQGTSPLAHVLAVATTPSDVDASAGTGTGTGQSDALDLSPLTEDSISKLRFRELHQELTSRQLPMVGTTSQLRDRLRQAAMPDNGCVVDEDGIQEDENCEPTVSDSREVYEVPYGFYCC
jgi:hypothetical protein